MLFDSKSHGIIYLEAQRLTIVTGAMTETKILNFAPEMVKDVEILKRQGIFAQIASFIDQNAIVPASLVMILASSIYFEKDSDINTKEGDQPATVDFLDTVPFEHPATATIKTEKASRVFATNKDFYETFVEGFIRKNFSIVAIFPASMLKQFSIPIETGLTQTTSAQLFKIFDTLKQFNMFMDHEEYKTDPVQDSLAKPKEGTKKSSKKNLYIMISVFIALLIVLAVMLLRK